jgi:hypothetical protein
MTFTAVVLHTTSGIQMLAFCLVDVQGRGLYALDHQAWTFHSSQLVGHAVAWAAVRPTCVVLAEVQDN